MVLTIGHRPIDLGGQWLCHPQYLAAGIKQQRNAHLPCVINYPLAVTQMASAHILIGQHSDVWLHLSAKDTRKTLVRRVTWKMVGRRTGLVDS